MIITKFIDYLNKRKNWNIQASYYTHIDLWRQWWQGYVPDFHHCTFTDAGGTKRARTLLSMRMPKCACEDWASLLLNDKTQLTLADETTAKWLLGSKEEQTGGMLQQLRFWPEANRLVELAFRSGTGAFVLGAEHLQIENGMVRPGKDARLYLDYLPAECILPITVQHGVVQDVAFATEVTIGGTACIYLQIHELTDEGYRITNEYYTTKNESAEDGGYEPAPLPQGVTASVHTGSSVPWFALLSPAGVKNIDGGAGLGMAVFSEAVDQAAHCDTCFNNYHQDMYLGGKKVFYNKSLLKTWIDKEGKEHTAAPDDIQQQLFVLSPADDPDTAQMVHEFNPDLRTEENSSAMQDALDYFSFKCGLGTRHYQFKAGNVMKTAAEYNGSRQDLVQHANRHQINVEAALLQIVRAILWAGKNLLGESIDPDTAVTVHWDDSYITDATTRRQQDKDDAVAGFIPKYRYNMEWRGMSEDEARKAVQEAADEMNTGEPLAFEGA